MIVDSEVLLSSSESLAVPAAAVNPDSNGRHRLFTVEDGKVVSHAVETPKMSDGWCSIRDGTVPRGAKVVAEGMLLVHEGDEVVAVEEEK